MLKQKQPKYDDPLQEIVMRNLKKSLPMAEAGGSDRKHPPHHVANELSEDGTHVYMYCHGNKKRRIAFSVYQLTDIMYRDNPSGSIDKWMYCPFCKTEYRFMLGPNLHFNMNKMLIESTYYINTGKMVDLDKKE